MVRGTQTDSAAGTGTRLPKGPVATFLLAVAGMFLDKEWLSQGVFVASMMRVIVLVLACAEAYRLIYIVGDPIAWTEVFLVFVLLIGIRLNWVLAAANPDAALQIIGGMFGKVGDVAGRIVNRRNQRQKDDKDE